MSSIASAKKVRTNRTVLWLSIAAGLLLVLGANAHLIYVAERSQPSCVAHVRQGESGPGRAFSAAQSACSTEGGVTQSRK